MEKELVIRYHDYESLDDLDAQGRRLMQQAMEAARGAYAPYSHFHVGAAVLLSDGTMVQGSNQENLAYPSGLCAERTAMFAASAQHPQARFEAIAVVGCNPEGQWVEAAPCGACRQVMAEYQQRQGQSIKIYLYREGGKVRVLDSVEALLPFNFSAEF